LTCYFANRNLNEYLTISGANTLSFPYKQVFVLIYSHKRVSYESIYIYLEIICTTSEQKVTKFEMFEQNRLLASCDFGCKLWGIVVSVVSFEDVDKFLGRKFGGAAGFE
jgi:hypothetical protein